MRYFLVSTGLILIAFPLFTSAATCPHLTRNLSFGSRGNDVVELQAFLIAEGDLAAGNSTGNFYSLTEAAVKQFQCRQNIICSGTPPSTGWGIVGPITRTVIAQVCAATAVPTGNTTSQTSTQATSTTTNTNTAQTAVPNPVVTGEIIDIDQTRFGQAFPTWNSHLPKMASDGVWDYAIYSRYPLNVDDRYAKIYKKKHGTSSWVYAGRTWRDIHQPPGIVIDTQGHIHVVFSCVLSNKACSDGGFNFNPIKR
ncbi:peptidoglycan-binding protein [Candidatus Kaiserbacteria bacterium]|nr:peptidoglycan-binding protein [Candidatus Kaiserbacteria bacterium]